MLIRIVKLSILEKHIDDFLTIFEKSKDKIRNSNGCRLLELYRDNTDPNIFFTYSHWESEQDLENYRHSVFFNQVWSSTKVLFDKKAEAWSVNKIEF